MSFLTDAIKYGLYPALPKAGQYLGPVASRGGLATLTSTTNKSAQDTTLHYAADDIVASKLLFANVYIDGTQGGSTFVEMTPAGNVTREASIQPSVGTATRYQYLFGGSASGIAAAGAIVETDWLTHPTIKAGQPFFTRNRHTGVNNCYVMADGLLALPGEGFELAATTTNMTMTGTMPAAGNTYRAPPVAVLGMTRKGTVLMLSNSRGRGIKDTLDGVGLAGALERSLAGMAVLNAAVGGDAVAKYVASHAVRNQLAAYCSHIIGPDTINDTARDGRTAGNALADLATFIGYFPTKPVWLPTCQPYTTGTFADLAGQTVQSQEAKRLAVNVGIRGYTVAGMAGLLDVAAPVEDAATGKWLPNMTGDGLHEVQAGALRVVAQQTVHPRQLNR